MAKFSIKVFLIIIFFTILASVLISGQVVAMQEYTRLVYTLQPEEANNKDKIKSLNEDIRIERLINAKRKHNGNKN